MRNLDSANKVAAALPGLWTPDPVSFEGNVAENWREFERHFTIYRKAPLKKCDPDEVAYILLNLAGPEAIERERTFTYKPEVKGEDTVVTPAESREDPDLLITKFRELCNPQTNIIVERHKFNTRNQREGETTEAYIMDLKKLGNQCEYGNLRNELVRDRIVCGIKNENIQRQMLKQADLTLERAIQLCQIDELTDERLKEMTTKAEINELKQERWKCRKCGQHHGYGKCPAFGSTCSKCSGRHHWAVMCNNPRNSHLMQYQQHQRNPESRREPSPKYSSGTKPKKKYKKVYELVEEDSEEGSNEERGYYIDY